jgi:hypothetical protein
LKIIKIKDRNMSTSYIRRLNQLDNIIESQWSDAMQELNRRRTARIEYDAVSSDLYHSSNRLTPKRSESPRRSTLSSPQRITTSNLQLSSQKPLRPTTAEIISPSESELSRAVEQVNAAFDRFDRLSTTTPKPSVGDTISLTPPPPPSLSALGNSTTTQGSPNEYQTDPRDNHLPNVTIARLGGGGDSSSSFSSEPTTSATNVTVTATTTATSLSQKEKQSVTESVHGVSQRMSQSQQQHLQQQRPQQQPLSSSRQLQMRVNTPMQNHRHISFSSAATSTATPNINSMVSGRRTNTSSSLASPSPQYLISPLSDDQICSVASAAAEG